MAKFALIMMTDENYPEGRGRMAHVIGNATALSDAGHEVEVHFHGAGVNWLKTWDEGEHPFTNHYRSRFDAMKHLIKGTCSFCTQGRFKVGAHADNLNVPIVGPEGGHADVAKLVAAGFQILTF